MPGDARQANRHARTLEFTNRAKRSAMPAYGYAAPALFMDAHHGPDVLMKRSAMPAGDAKRKRAAMPIEDFADHEEMPFVETYGIDDDVKA